MDIQYKRDRLKQQGINAKEDYYNSLCKKATDKEIARYERKKRIAIKKYTEKFDRKTKDLIRKSEGKVVKVRVKKVSDAKIKQKAYIEFQKYAKVSRLGKGYMKGFVYVVDKQLWKPREETVGGHCWSKKNYPQLAFEIDNVRPITPMTNKRQMENTGWDWIKNTGLGQDRIDELEWIANNKSLKNIVRDRNYYLGMYEKYKLMNALIIGNIYHEKKKKSD